MFSALALGLAWLVCLPLWILPVDLNPETALRAQAGAPGGSQPADLPTLAVLILPQLLIALMMFVPTIAALVAGRWVDGLAWSRLFVALGLGPVRSQPGFAPVRGGAGRVIRICLLALFGTCALVVAALGVAFVISSAAPRLEGTVLAAIAAGAGQPASMLLVIQLAAVLIGALVNVIPAAGEEIGWRGYLQPALAARFGLVPALVIGGLLWGAWHSPVLLLGYNFGLYDLRAVGLMCIACILLGTWMGWLRGISGSVWPPALAHGAFNAAAGLVILFLPADGQVDVVRASALGVSGWVVMLPLAIVLVIATGRARGRTR